MLENVFNRLILVGESHLCTCKNFEKGHSFSRMLNFSSTIYVGMPQLRGFPFLFLSLFYCLGCKNLNIASAVSSRNLEVVQSKCS